MERKILQIIVDTLASYIEQWSIKLNNYSFNFLLISYTVANIFGHIDDLLSLLRAVKKADQPGSFP